MHIGNLRTALYAWLFARHNNGQFLLRIEDTDRNRLVDGACDVIYNTLRDTGLYYDEGPDVGGDYGPYVQSERKEIYGKYARALVEKGAAYYCFCTKERLDALREEYKNEGKVFKYDKKCLSLTKEEVQQKLDAGEEYVIRQNIPLEGESSYDDLVYGHISVPMSDMEDNILLKSDGWPTYNLANVIDDHLMEISHVIRGVEYLSSTPKYNLLYDALGWERPSYVHLPPVMKDKTAKLSKRNGDASFQDLLVKGYLPEAILNYIALLGWSPSEDREIYSLEELAKAFDVKRIGTTGAIFDIDKLTWMNGVYLRSMDRNDYYELVRPYITDVLSEERFDYKLVADAIHDRVSILSEIAPMISFFNKADVYESEIFTNKKAKTDADIAGSLLPQATLALKDLDVWNNETIFTSLAAKAQEIGVKNITLMYPLQVALSGRSVAPGGATAIAEILGKEETLKRLNEAISRLG